MTDHAHDWVLNFDWDGGPSPYPIAQCIVCNWTDIEAAAGPRLTPEQVKTAYREACEVAHTTDTLFGVMTERLTEAAAGPRDEGLRWFRDNEDDPERHCYRSEDGDEVVIYASREQAETMIAALAATPASSPPLSTRTAPEADHYERWVGRVADAIHEDCRLEWQAIAAVDPERMVTQHGPDAHYGMAHDLVRRLDLATPAPEADHE